MLPDIERYRVGDVFKSRKNRVFRVRIQGEIRVAKVYAPERIATAQAELELLTNCSERGLLVPTPLELVDSTIVMTYLEGPNVMDIADSLVSGVPVHQGRCEVTISSLSDGLADWLVSFHRSFDDRMCRGDTTLRNFVVSSGRIYGLDFEEAHEGDPILDIGELCANVLGMRPLFGSLNFEFASGIVSAYHSASGKDRSADVSEAIAVGLEHYARFRQDGGLLEEWARRFRKEGTALLEQNVHKI